MLIARPSIGAIPAVKQRLGPLGRRTEQNKNPRL